MSTGKNGDESTDGLAELTVLQGTYWGRLVSPRLPASQVPAVIPHRRLGVCQAELHFHDILRTQPQIGTENRHED